jgi:hypothetical protein
MTTPGSPDDGPARRRRRARRPEENNPFRRPIDDPALPVAEAAPPGSAPVTITQPDGSTLGIVFAEKPTSETTEDERLAELEAMAALDVADHFVRIVWPRFSKAKREEVALTLSHQARTQMLGIWRVLRMQGRPELPWPVLRALAEARAELARAYAPWATNAATAQMFPLSPLPDAAWLRARERHLLAWRQSVRRPGSMREATDAELALMREADAADAELAEIRRQLRQTPGARVRRAPGGLTLAQQRVAFQLAKAISRATPDRRRASADYAGHFRHHVLDRTRDLLEVIFGVRVPRRVLMTTIQHLDPAGIQLRRQRRTAAPPTK